MTRVISYLPGVPLSTVSLTARLSRNMGLALAWLGIGLQEFEHAGVEQSLLWDMQEALALRKLLPHVPDRDTRHRVAALREHYGLRVECRQLVSERDQNFHLTTADNGREFVLKIANSAEDPQVTHCQIEALLHLQDEISAAALSVRVPELLMTRDGRSHLLVR